MFSACIAAIATLTTGQAFAHGARHHHTGSNASSSHSHHHRHTLLARAFGRHHAHLGREYAYGAHVIQCVAFAKEDAGIEIRGNARDWWSRAAGVYERGSQPEAGSVLSFLSTGRMPLGHVAVVSGIRDSRTILIDQSHWNSRGITRDIEVKDVSENNDWTAVRVQLSHGGAFGSIYPTHGFIYPRPAGATVMANDVVRQDHDVVATQAVYRAPSRVAARPATEVAEAPANAKPLDLRLPGISFDAPNRSWR